MLKRFIDKIKILDNGCHQWLGCITADGYGRFWDGKKVVQAYRYAYEEKYGVTSKNLSLDHLCRNRYCVNPDHLEPVTRGENVRRGTNWNRNKLQCNNGHIYDKDNTYIYADGRRQCKICRRVIDAKRRQKL